jgi:hypothetical protein
MDGAAGKEGILFVKRFQRCDIDPAVLRNIKEGVVGPEAIGFLPRSFAGGVADPIATSMAGVCNGGGQTAGCCNGVTRTIVENGDGFGGIAPERACGFDGQKAEHPNSDQNQGDANDAF